MKKLTYTALAIGLGLAMQTKTSVASLLPIDDACEQGDYVKMLSLMEEEAKEQGEYQLNRQSRLAEAYATGEKKCVLGGGKINFPPNIDKAIYWYNQMMFSKETKSFYPYYAKFQLAEIYFFGKEGVEKNGILAKRYYQELANLNDSVIQQAEDTGIQLHRGSARHRFAQMYYFGKSVPQDYQKAYQWASKGWADVSPYAGQMVAVMQYEGRGTAQNRRKATELMRKLCDTWSDQQMCDLYQDMRANRPLRSLSL